MRDPLRSLLSRWSLAGGLLLVFVALAGVGCGGGGSSKQAVVSGKVSYKGAPVTGGNMEFHPKAGGASVPGTINFDGTFHFGGIPKGDYTVTIETDSVRFAQAAYGDKTPAGVDTSKQPKYVPIPAKYRDPKQSTVSWTITGTADKMEIELTD